VSTGILLFGRHPGPSNVQKTSSRLDAFWTLRRYRQCMEQHARRPPQESFVIRIDTKAHDPQERWRATVVHVASGERRYVTSYGEVCGFIEEFRRVPQARG